MSCIYVSANIADAGVSIAIPYICNISGSIENNFVPFLLYVLFNFGYFL
jgi:hypothetical protein